MTDASTLEQVERDRLQALVAGDIATADRLHADDYELIPPGGRAISKADYLDLIGSGAMRYVVFEPDGEVRVRLYADAAIVRYRARIEVASPDGGSDAGIFWHTDAYELRDGRWQAVWSQATRIPSPD